MKSATQYRALMLLAAAPLWAPGRLGAQEPTSRLREMLSAESADMVIAIVEDATARGLPGRAIATRALEGVAKGRSGTEVVAAARQLATQLDAAHDALRNAGRQPEAAEIEAAAQAMSLGVSGAEVSRLAAAAPSGRSLTMPLAVIAALVGRNLPSDQALEAVQLRLEARAPDAELARVPDQVGQMLGQGIPPREVGLALAGARAGFPIPVAGAGIPVVAGVPFGPPGGIPVNGGTPADRPGSSPIAPRPPIGRRP
jgi:hypothetical protein